MDSLNQSQPPPNTIREELNQAKAILNLFVVTKGQIPEEEYAIAVATLRALLIDARPRILDTDQSEYARILRILSDEPLNQLRTKSTLDDVQDTLTYIIENAEFGQITEDLYAAVMEKKTKVK